MLQGRMESLQKKHKELDNKIEELYKHSNTDKQISVLKKQKLLIKDELSKLRKEQQNG